MGVWIRSGMLPYVTGEGIYEIYRGRKRRKEMQRMEIENNRLQLQLLLEQIEPHFIYNALGAIRELIRENPNEAYHALYDFSKYLRQHIGVCDAMSLIDFSTELDHIQTYLSLEKVRFEDLLTVRYDIAFVDFQVPPLTIQPFVENAVKHGIFQKETGGTITLSAYKDEETIHIVIRDDGAGFDVEETMRRIDLTNVSYGMRNAMRRLKKLCDADCGIESTPENGTTVHITMPFVQCALPGEGASG
jgi:sensor histidine kinase YesM